MGFPDKDHNSESHCYSALPELFVRDSHLGGSSSGGLGPRDGEGRERLRSGRPGRQPGLTRGTRKAQGNRGEVLRGIGAGGGRRKARKLPNW